MPANEWASVAAIVALVALSSCDSSPEVVNTTIEEPSDPPEVTATVAAPTPEVLQTEALPTVTAAWLVGTWGPASANPANDPYASCDTDVIITFKSDGTFADGGAEGRYVTDGRAIRYTNRLSVQDVGDDTDAPFTPEPLEDVTASVHAVDQNTFLEDGTEWRRCVSS